MTTWRRSGGSAYRLGLRSLIGSDDEESHLGIKEQYRKRGIDAILYLDTLRAARRLGYKGGEISWTLEDNVLVNRAIEMMGGRRYKTYRMYESEV